MTSPAELLEVADGAVDAAVGRLQAVRLEPLRTEMKSSTADLVTQVDRELEAAIVAHLERARPQDGLIGEEGTRRPSTTGVSWLIDPIDGTTNYVYDLPGYAISLAAAGDGEVLAGVVHDPIREERFRAAVGAGSSLDGKPLKVKTAGDLELALVATGFSYDPEDRRRQARVLVEVLHRVRDMRRSGGAAYDLCALAAGRVDAYYERDLNLWDHAAAGLIAREAGARVADPSPEGLLRDTLVASSAALFPAFWSLLEVAYLQVD